jgi:hypothetical protein
VETPPGGRLQIGTMAGFISERVAGFILECMAGFVGIRTVSDLASLEEQVPENQKEVCNAQQEIGNSKWYCDRRIDAGADSSSCRGGMGGRRRVPWWRTRRVAWRELSRLAARRCCSLSTASPISTACIPVSTTRRCSSTRFDILPLGGDDLRRLPLSMRKQKLSRLLFRPPSGIFAATFEQGRDRPRPVQGGVQLGARRAGVEAGR